MAEGEETGDVTRETVEAGTAAEPGDAQTDQPEGETLVASDVPAGPSLDTGAASALRRLRERPCCGSSQVLSRRNQLAPAQWLAFSLSCYMEPAARIELATP